MARRLLIVITLGLATVASSGNFSTAYAWANGRVGMAAGVDLAAAAGGVAGGAGVIPAGAAVRVGAGVLVGVGAWAGSEFPAGAGPGSRVSPDCRSPLGEREYSGRRWLPSVFRAQLWRTRCGMTNRCAMRGDKKHFGIGPCRFRPSAPAGRVVDRA